MAGVTTQVALSFLLTLSAVLVYGIDKVLDAICDWAGLC